MFQPEPILAPASKTRNGSGVNETLAMGRMLSGEISSDPFSSIFAPDRSSLWPSGVGIV